MQKKASISLSKISLLFSLDFGVKYFGKILFKVCFNKEEHRNQRVVSVLLLTHAN